MEPRYKETEPADGKARHRDLIERIRRWPEWKIRSFCLDQTDLRLIREIKADTMPPR